MAVDSFFHDKSGIDAIITDVRTSLDNYSQTVGSLESLINEMNGSSAWVDDQVKTSFVNTANSYISLYRTFYGGLESLINCLEKKSENISEHETNYS